MLQIEGRCSV